MGHDTWQEFSVRWSLNEQQVDQFKRYFALLIEKNKLFNLTTIVDEPSVLDYHFADSLFVTRFFPVEKSVGLLDVGTGAGVPGVLLAIIYPQLPVLLMEVTEKKRDFLALVKNELHLDNVSITAVDWRNFLRQKPVQKIDLVCARASLRPDELVHMFKETSPYRDATLIYWASQDFVLGRREQRFFVREERYRVGDRERRYIFFRDVRA
ncbi:MAG: class I SAM-dependent methyltransferase [Candidatus Babeliaceae bacterium]|nr:class I SAM-dependent methyltransferase [Candidatus Babeliaceae bacterium]